MFYILSPRARNLQHREWFTCRPHVIHILYRVSNRWPLNKKFVEAQVGDVELTFADVAKFRNTFGYTPRMKLHDGVAKFVEWYATHYESTFN